MRQLPEGWHEPTPLALEAYVEGVENGMVPTDHEALKRDADYVPLDEITGAQARDIVARMWRFVEVKARTKRGIAGLAAPQLGESAQVIIVPHQTEEGKLMAVFNPTITINESSPPKLVPNGCFSAPDMLPKLWCPTLSALEGYDEHGEPLTYYDEVRDEVTTVLPRVGKQAIVDDHEGKHLHRIRMPDIAYALGQQVDYSPPETTDEYRAFFEEFEKGPTPENPQPENWGPTMQKSQWDAMVTGDFALRHYL